MVTNWITNLPIRHKLTLITIVGLISILLMGFTANYFYGTSRVLHILTNGQRLHTFHFQQGLEIFYRHLLNEENEHGLEQGLMHIIKANKMAETFSESVLMAQTMTNDEFSDRLFAVLDEAMNNDPSLADLMVNRLKFFLMLKNQRILETIALAGMGAEKGDIVLEAIRQYVNDPNPEQMGIIKQAVDDIHDYYFGFSMAVGDVIGFANRLLLILIFLTTALLLIITIIVSTLISRKISRPIEKLTSHFREIAKGNIEEKIVIKGKDEIGKLGLSFNEMQENLQNIVGQTELVAEGNFSSQLEPKSDKDRLSIAINRMTTALKRSSEKNEAEDWLKTGLNQVNQLLMGDHDLQVLSAKAIQYLAPYTGALVGAMYLYEEDSQELLLSGTYAFNNRKQLSNRFALGEGLVGQAAVEKQIISVSELPADYSRIQSAIGNMFPRNVVVVPMVYDNKLIGVFELGTKDGFSELQMDLLRAVSESIAIYLLSATSRTKMKTLLEKTQTQSEELQAQQEELRVTNEELAEQTKIIKQSEEELRLQQEELLHTNAQLEEKAQQLEEQNEAIRIKNEEVVHAREAIALKAKELELTSKYKSEFLANMSHEFRTPLNSMLILSRLLMENKSLNLTDKQLEYAEVIHKSGQDLLNLINEVLDLSKLESRKIDLNPGWFELEEVRTDIEAVFREVASDKYIEFKCSLQPGTPEKMYTDKFRLEQVIKNLLSNAFKFTDKGGHISLTIFKAGDLKGIHAPLLLNAPAVVGFSVKDSGIGIPEEKQKMIFEAFQQADGTTSRRYGGTGLGLSISRELASILEGELTVDSTPGEGSTFTLFLPVEAGNLFGNQQPEETITEPAAPSKPETTPTNTDIPALSFAFEDDRDKLTGGDKLILIIEDDEAFARILMDYAHEKNCKAIIAEQGDTGLLMARTYKPHAIILDIGLPVMDGWAVLKAIKKEHSLMHIPVHIMTGSDNEKLGRELGAIEFLKKPVSEETISRVFQTISEEAEKSIQHVLVVEDNPNQQKSLKELFQSRNIIAIPATTGKEAWEALNAHPIDAIILDLILPDTSGTDLLKKIKKNKQFASIPVIVYTGKELDQAETRELLRYSNTVVTKRIKSNDRLLQEVNLFLKKVEDHTEGNLAGSRVPPQLMEELKNKKVLLVDDDMRNIFALSKLLEDQDMIVLVANDGLEALQKLEEHPDTDVVLMDIMMPEMDGYETTKRIRKQKHFDKLPVIALTAKAMKGDREKCIEAGASDYLSKPVDNGKLLSMIRMWLFK